MKIYSTRHGQTSYNKQEIVLGTTDIELDETGEKQALMLAEKIADMNCIDIIIASPMKRAMRTARAVAER